MSDTPRILAFAGSTRTDSFNKKVGQIAAQAARDAGADVTWIDLRDFALPLFDEDLERAGTPEAARRLTDLFVQHQGLLISSPEYNSSISGVLKNAIDWVSRPVPGQPSLHAFSGKTAVLMSASTGALGGLRGLVHVRAILGNIGVLVLPEQMAIAKANDALADDGSLRDPKQQAGIQRLGIRLVEVLRKLA